MDTVKWFEKLNKHEQSLGRPFILPDNDSEKGYGWESAEETVMDLLSGEDEYTLIAFPFGELHEYHTVFYGYYAKSDAECAHGRCDKVKKEFALSAAYGYLNHAFSYDFRIRGENTRKPLSKVVFVLHQLILSGWWQEAEELTKWIIQDIAIKDEESMKFVYFDNLIVRQMAWFILRLAAKVFDHEIDDSYYPFLQSENPREWRFYTETLEGWDSNDISFIDKQTYLLSDLYIMDGVKAETPTNNDYTSSESLIGTSYMNPYPIMTWLKLREYQGLKNPKVYSHALINHPSAIYFEGSLEKPTDLPFVKELTAFLLTKEPEFPLPAFFVEIN